MLTPLASCAIIVRMGRPLCIGRPGFTDPDRATPEDLALCQKCPIRQQCATDALTSGSTLDWAHSGPADGVIAAGVVCHGDKATTEALAAVAHCTPPPRPRLRQPAITPGTHCRQCHREMTPRPRGADVHLGPGTVTHCARGLCRVCYQRAIRQGMATRPQSTIDHLERTA